MDYLEWFLAWLKFRNDIDIDLLYFKFKMLNPIGTNKNMDKYGPSILANTYKTFQQISYIKHANERWKY